MSTLGKKLIAAAGEVGSAPAMSMPDDDRVEKIARIIINTRRTRYGLDAITMDKAKMFMHHASIEDAFAIARAILETLSSTGGEDWQPIDTAPKDGTRFLAMAELKADEIDEDGRMIKRGIIERYQVVAYYVFGGFVEMPWRGSFVQNLKFTHWQPLPAPKSINPNAGGA